jgi:hypothetical protein
MNDEAVEVRLARIEVKLDTFLSRVMDHEGRLRTLEKKIWGATGLSSVVAAALTAFATMGR